MGKKKYIFGPIPSRRLGISLGLDLVPSKVCNLNCVYCECGKTTTLTTKQGSYTPASEIIAELKEYLQNEPPHIDVITLTGSGEPTLNEGLGEIIEFIQTNYPKYKVAVLTNSGALINSDVREKLLKADYVLPSIDAMFEESFKRINNPAPELKCDDIIDGLRAFAKEYKGTLWVECFILPNVNDSIEELTLFKEFFTEIQPTRVQINSMDRPGTCDWVEAPSIERLKEIEHFLQPLPVEIISRKAKSMEIKLPAPTELDEIVETIRRRPLTVEDLSTSLLISINETVEIINKLVEENKIVKSELNGRVYYKVVS